jgi:hypothetical protein
MAPETLIDALRPESAEALARLLALEATVLDPLGRSLLAGRPRRQSEQLLGLLAQSGAPRAPSR